MDASAERVRRAGRALAARRRAVRSIFLYEVYWLVDAVFDAAIAADCPRDDVDQPYRVCVQQEALKTRQKSMVSKDAFCDGFFAQFGFWGEKVRQEAL